MSYKIIDGQRVSQEVMSDLKKDVSAFVQQTGQKPGLAVVIVGDNPASRVYVNRKKKACADVGFASWEHALASDVQQSELLALIDRLNQDSQVHGILVQLPLPKHLDEQEVLLAIDPRKDVDGFHPYNVGQMVVGEPTFMPCTPYGIYELLRRSEIETEGKHVVVIGRSNIVGKPMAMIMVQKMPGANATVTLCHSRTHNMEQITRQADILIAAIGQPHFVTKDMIKEGAVVVDVGINRVDDPHSDKGYRIVGDVDFDQVAPITQAITPVPGGVGPMTIAMLLQNTMRAAQQLSSTRKG